MASGGIYLLSGTDLVELAETAYESEALLQGYLDNHPKLLAGEQIDAADPRRWLLIRREAPVPDSETSGGRWAVDHLFVDQTGIPTLVEAKRSTDSRIRREVVGQMLDYAANAVAFWPIDHLVAQFERTCATRGVDPDEEIRTLTAGEYEPAEFWQQVKTNLQAGRIRMMFVADVIRPELQRIVEFLNEQLDPAEVYAVEVRKYSSDTATAFVPRLVGATIQAQQHKGGGRPSTQWTVEAVLDDIETRSGHECRTITERLVSWATQNGLTLKTGTGEMGTVSPKLAYSGTLHHMFSVYANGRLMISLGSFRPPFDDLVSRQHIVDRFNQALGTTLPVQDVETSHPAFDLTHLSDPGRFDRFTAVWNHFIATITTND